MDIATTIHDPDGIMSSWLEKHESTLQRLNSKIYVAHTKNTDKSLISKLNKLGTKTFVGGLWGESRLATLDLAGKDNCENLLFVDFDKILSWLDNCPEEFEKIIQSKPDCDFSIIGRDDETMSTYPISWQKTEGIVDYLVSQIL